MKRWNKNDVDMIINALDVLGKALADHGHIWTDAEREAYEMAITALESDKPSKHHDPYKLTNEELARAIDWARNHSWGEHLEHLLRAQRYRAGEVAP